MLLLIAEANDVDYSPQTPRPVFTAACLKICASIPNPGVQELPNFRLNGTENAVVEELLRFHMVIPEIPSISVKLADDAAERYPANGSKAVKRISDGSVRDW